MHQTEENMSQKELSGTTKPDQSVVQKTHEELMAAFDPQGPSEEIVIEILASAYAQWKEVESFSLGSTKSIFKFEAEARVKNSAARHLKEMIFALRELQRAPLPTIQVKHAEQVQVAVLGKDV